MELEKIKKIAKKVREKFERGNISKELIKKLYIEYRLIQNVDSFFKRADQLFPNLNCGIASVYLKRKIKDSKIVQGKYKDNNHTFIITQDNLIVDITSDQYGGPKIYVGPIKSPWCLE